MRNYCLSSIMLLSLWLSTGCSLLPGHHASNWKQPGPLVRMDNPSLEEAVEAKIKTAQSLFNAGHYREAASLLETARLQNPESYNYSRQLAVIYDELNLAERADQEFQLAIHANQTDADIWNDYGYFQTRQKQYQQAEQSYLKALQIKPEHKKAKMNLATCLVNQNRLQEAFQTFAEVVGPAAAHQNMGVLLIESGQVNEAQVAFRQALELDPSLNRSREFLAQVDQESLHR